MKLRIEFKLADCWVGVFWKVTKPREVCHCGDYCDQHRAWTGHDPVPMPEPDLVDVWICLIPYFPIHISYLR